MPHLPRGAQGGANAPPLANGGTRMPPNDVPARNWSQCNLMGANTTRNWSPCNKLENLTRNWSQGNLTGVHPTLNWSQGYSTDVGLAYRELESR